MIKYLIAIYNKNFFIFIFFWKKEIYLKIYYNYVFLLLIKSFLYIFKNIFNIKKINYKIYFILKILYNYIFIYYKKVIILKIKIFY